MAERVLVGDIGATRARFALAEGGRLRERADLAVADRADGADALRTALDRLGAPRVAAVRLAVAGVVEDGRAALTNGDWRFDAADIARLAGARSVSLTNDVQAAALALPRLAPADAAPLGDCGAPDFTRPVALAMVGTGFGASCLVPAPGGHMALATEAGHAALPAADAWEARVLARLRRRGGRVSVETALSGGGLSALRSALGGGAPTPPEAVVAAALAGRAPDAAALDLFCALLGAAAGDLALTCGAWGGVAIAGGVPRRFAAFLKRSRFRERFEDKGKMAARLRRAPTVLIERDDLALIGLAGAETDRHPAGQRVPA